jgi:uncharacterized protein YbjT (DUF2867 family)
MTTATSSKESKKLIAVIGASGQQGGGVVQALKSRGGFLVRALTRRVNDYRGPADEVVAADLARPETLAGAFKGAHGVFLVTNFWEKSAVSEAQQAQAAIRAAKEAGVQHFIWSTLPNVQEISGGAFHVPHFTHKAEVDAVVAAAGFPAYTFVEAPFYFQNLSGQMAPQPQADGSKAWTLPLDPSARCIHIGDISDLGKIVAGAFERPEQVGRGQHLSLASALVSFDEIVSTLRSQGHNVSFRQVPGEVFAGFFPGAEEMVAMCQYWQKYTYFGPHAEEKVALARSVATAPFTDFASWARQHMPATVAA